MSLSAGIVADVVERTPIYDIHTHLYDPAFGELLLWGIDELLVYHYLIAEGFRQFDLPYDKFWSLTKTQQADAIWQALFIDHSPISEACRGVLTVLNALVEQALSDNELLLHAWQAARHIRRGSTKANASASATPGSA